MGSLLSLQVDELEPPGNYCKIMLFFGINPYFSNKVIVKEYLTNSHGEKFLRDLGVGHEVQVMPV